MKRSGILVIEKGGWSMLNMIETRISRRSYLDKPLERATADKLREIVQEENLRSGLDIHFIREGEEAFASVRRTYGILEGVQSFFVIKGSKADPDLKEKAGYAGERLLLQAAAMGLGTCWVGGTYDNTASVVMPEPGEELIALIVVGHVQEAETLHEKNIKETLPRVQKTPQQRYTASGEVPDWFIRGMEMVVKAPSAGNTQRPMFHYDNGEVWADVPETEPFDMVDLGIAKLHFEIGACGRFALGNGGRFFKAQG